MKPTFFSLFSGGDLAGTGAKAAGFEIAGGVEYDPDIADVARANDCPVTVSAVEEADPMDAPCVPDVLWASPVCTRASVANANAGESELDMVTAKATARWIETLLPPNFVLENVQGYMKFEAYGLIRDTLDRCGYWTQASVLNSADFGVPQTRRRLILRATRNGFLPPLPRKEKWVGWYKAIEDLISELPESQFAEWQLARLPDLAVSSLVKMTHRTGADLTARCANEPAPTITAQCGRRHSSAPSAFLVPGGNATAFSIRYDDEPARTIGDVNRIGNVPRAFIANGTPNDRGQSLTTRDDGEPVFSIVAQSGQRQQLRAWLSQGRVVKMTPRALARFQSVPDDYLLPDKAALACRVIGNGVPCTLAQKIVASLAA